MSDQFSSHLLDLPPAMLAFLFQTVASGPGGLANAASLSQTCKLLYSLSEGPDVIYSNLSLAAAISSPDHPAWQWLAKRIGRIAGLSLDLRLELPDDGAVEMADHSRDWIQPLQTLSGIAGVQLRLEWVDRITSLRHPCTDQWLKQHGQIISHLTVEVDISHVPMLSLRKFCRTAAPCRSVDLTIWHTSQVVNLADLVPVAGSLQRLTCKAFAPGSNTLRGSSAFSSMSQLVALNLLHEQFENEEPWGHLAKLTSLQQLSLKVTASGDPSPLSALTSLSCLILQTNGSGEDEDLIPSSFSSLQPLSTLIHLEELQLRDHACAATSLQGLAGLSNLRRLVIGLDSESGRLASLEGISSGVTKLRISHASPGSAVLAGIHACTSLEKLSLFYVYQLSSLQCLRGLSSLRQLELSSCSLTSLEGLNMPLESLSLSHCISLTHMSGFEHLSALKSLKVIGCMHVTSLQALSQLGEGLQKLDVCWCYGVTEAVLELPHVQPTADVHVGSSKVKEVVLAGGVRLAFIA
jgi:hypothetical protein